MRRLFAVVLMAMCSSVGASDTDERPALAATRIALIRAPVGECNPSPEALAKKPADA